jgi:hypothetical protein
MGRIGWLAVAAVVAGCGGAGKAPANDDFGELAGLDAKSDAFSKRMSVLGWLDYQNRMGGVSYTSTPRYRAWRFTGYAGDPVSVSVRPGKAGGDPVTWLLDHRFRRVAMNDDATDSDTSSYLYVELPADDSYYVVVRSYDLQPADFTVELEGFTPVGDPASDAKSFYDHILGTADASATDPYFQIDPSALPDAAAAEAKSWAKWNPAAARTFSVWGDDYYAISDGTEELFWVSLYDAWGTRLAHGYDGDSGPEISTWDPSPYDPTLNP